MAETNIGNIIGAAAEKLKELAGTETVIGNPIVTANGTTVIPVSKVSVGIASGGIDYNSKKAPAKAPKNFGGGGGTGINIAPVAFLIIAPNGQVNLLPITTNSGDDKLDKITSFIERSPELLEKIKDVFVKKAPDTTDVEEIAEDIVSADEAQKELLEERKKAAKES